MDSEPPDQHGDPQRAFGDLFCVQDGRVGDLRLEQLLAKAVGDAVRLLQIGLINGPSGTVVGADVNEPAVQRARSNAAALQLDNVELFCGDVHDLDAAAVGGPFDLAHTRLFLMHQTDPGKTLRRIADPLRPGGWIVAQEALRYPPPRSHPHHDSLGAYWDLLHGLLEQLVGVPRDSVDSLPQLGRAAGLEVVVNGSFGTMDPGVGFDLHADTLAAARERGVASGRWTGEQVDALVTGLRNAKDQRLPRPRPQDALIAGGLHRDPLRMSFR